MAERLYYNDVWASADGKEWERLLEHAPWDPRSCATHSSSSSQTLKNEKIRIVLTKRTRLCPDHDVAVFDGELWVLGGCNTEAQDPEEVGVDGNQSESRPSLPRTFSAL